MKILKLTLRVALPNEEDVPTFLEALENKVYDLLIEEEVDECPAVPIFDPITPEDVLEATLDEPEIGMSGIAGLSPDYDEYAEGWERWRDKAKEMIRASIERQS